MNDERQADGDAGRTPPDPNCSECGGTGTTTIHRPLMDRIDEIPVPCPRCRPRGGSRPAPAR